MKKNLLVLLVAAWLATACRLTQDLAARQTQTLVDTPSLRETTLPAETPKITEPTPTPAGHRIGVRVVDGVGEFYDRATGEKFVPRGSNYIRLENQQAPGGSILFHSTFNTGSYEPDRAQQALTRMRAEGYNTVRVFLNGCCLENALGDPAGGLSPEYIANLVDFLNIAKANQIYVLLEPGHLPVTGGYIEILDSTWSEDFAGNSAAYLRPGGLQANIQQWRDLINELIRQDAPLDIILAYELRNEAFFDSNLPPFSLTSGKVQTANGKTYDMASAEDKQRMMDEGLLYWIDSLRAEILSLDPTALVTIGFFVPQEPHPARPGDPRQIKTRPAIWESSADFIDLHAYPGKELTLAQYVDNFGLDGMQAKPIIMGEFGAARSAFASEAGAAQALHDWQVDSCDYGFDGWLLWTWDTQEQSDFYNGLTGDGLIDQVLMPANRPDPCEPVNFSFFEYNLALGKVAQASSALPDQPPSGAVDGSTTNWWGAGAPAPQWIQIDLSEPSTIGSIRLVVSQSPEGDTRHQVWVGPTLEDLFLLHTFQGYTVDGQVLEFKPEDPIENVRIIRLTTTESPSWVGWQEIEVLAP
jgi:hypothetical protein